MLTNEASNAIFDRILAGQAAEADIAKLRDELQRGKFNIEIESVTAGDFHLGDRIYNGIDAETLRRILREIRDSQADIETIKQAVREVLQSLKPPLPSLEEQRKAVCQFLRSVEERFNTVELLHRRGETIALKDQYIPIQVTLEKQREISSAGRYLGYLESEAELQRAYALKRENEENKREQVDWQEAKKQHQRIMVLADPGMGKTTLLRMEAGTMAHQERQGLEEGSKTLETVILPVWIRLSNLAEVVQQATDAVLEAILKLVRADCDDRVFANLQPLLEEKLRTGKCLLLLDALDEVPRTLRDRLSEKLNNFARMYSCPIVCTSRIMGYTELLKGATEVEIVPFSQKQTEQYIKTWFTNAAGHLENESVSAVALIRELRNKPQICGLVQNPLLLSLICSLYQTQGLTLPARRCQVYEKAVEFMLSKWSRSSKRQAGAKLQAKTRLLEYLAYQFTCDGIEIFSADQLYIKLSEYLEDSSIPLMFRKFETDDPIDELSTEDGILQQLSEKSYLFLHRTFQEYFTACYLMRAGARGIQLAKAHLWNYEWHETISLMAGLMEEPISLIQEILHEKDDIFYTQLLLAGRCLTECTDSVKPMMMKIVEETISKIHQFWCYHPCADFIESIVVTIGKTDLDQSRNLQNFLQDQNNEIRASAAETLGKIGTPEAVSALFHVLQNEDGDFRARPVEVLGEVGAPEAVSIRLQTFQDEVGASPVYALGKIGTPKAVSALLNIFQDKNSSVRMVAAEVLGEIGAPEAVSILLRTFQDEDEDNEVRGSAAEALGIIGTPEAIPTLLNALQDQEKDGSVRLSTVYALYNIGTPESIPAFLHALQDTDNRVRAGAAAALNRVNAPDAVLALSNALQDEDSQVRLSTVDTLGNIGTPDAVSALLHALQDEDSQVRARAVDMLGNIGTPDAVSALLHDLQDEDNQVRARAAEVLGRFKLGTPKVISALLHALQDEDSQVRESAAEAFVFLLFHALRNEHSDDRTTAAKVFEMFTPEEVPTLLYILWNKSNNLRQWVAQILGTPKVISALLHALQDEDSHARKSAAEALGNIGAPEAVPALLHALQYGYDGLREKAAEALGNIGAPEAVPALLHALQEEYRVGRSAAEALGKIGTVHPKVVLEKFLQYSELNIYRSETFLLVRQLTIRVSREGGDCVPVYPERVKSLT